MSFPVSIMGIMLVPTIKLLQRVNGMMCVYRLNHCLKHGMKLNY